MEIVVQHTGILWRAMLFQIGFFIFIWIILWLNYIVRKAKGTAWHRGIYIAMATFITILGIFALRTYEFVFHAVDYSFDNTIVIEDTIKEIQRNNKGLTLHGDKHSYRLLPKDYDYHDTLEEHCLDQVSKIECYRWSKYVIRIKVKE